VATRRSVACAVGDTLHAMARSEEPKEFLTQAELAALQAAIAAAETATSAELRVHLERRVEAKPKVKRPVFVFATGEFERLGMKRTAARNGVLIVLAIANREFVILGDEGINRLVAPTFWDAVRDAMAARFAQDDFAGGLAEGVALAGTQLAAHFPRQEGDVDELPDAISFGA